MQAVVVKHISFISVPYVLLPILQNLSGNPKCSLVVAKDPEDRTDTVITVYGDAVPVSDEQKDLVRSAYLRRHPDAFWVCFLISLLFQLPKTKTILMEY
jgi:hypothetical protein